MTWLLLTCFSGVLAVPLLAATVTGRVTLCESRERAARSLSDYSGGEVWLQRPAEPAAAIALPVKMLGTDRQ